MNVTALCTAARAELRGPRFDMDPLEPMAAVVARVRRDAGDAAAVLPLLEAWKGVDLGSASGEMRYPWPLCHRRTDAPGYAPPVSGWRPWRAAEAAAMHDVYEFEERFLTPLVLCAAGELLLETIEGGAPPEQALARALFAQAEPVLRQDLARHSLGHYPWQDTLALWCALSAPRLSARMQPFMLAIASTWAPLAREAGGRVLGLRFPLHDKFLPSATAQLALSLYSLGCDLDLVPALVGAVAGARSDSGGWGDAGGADDLMTTWACASLLLRLDPGFDPEPTARRLAQWRTPEGTWRAFGPEEPWLTVRVVEWLEASEQPFAARFRWPDFGAAERDRKTGIPGFGWFTQVATAFEAIPTLGDAPMQVAFIDLAGFKQFNNAHGQDAGDRAIRLFAQHLVGLGEAAAVRDGGDEFLALGPPTGTSLPEALERMRASWPAVFARAFGAETGCVAPRILLGQTLGRRLRTARELLGRGITALKQDSPTPPPTGAVKRIEGAL